MIIKQTFFNSLDKADDVFDNRAMLLCVTPPITAIKVLKLFIRLRHYNQICYRGAK